MSQRSVAVFGNYAERARRDAGGRPWIRGYTDALSYGPGDAIGVHVNTNVQRYSVSITRLSAEPEVVFARDGLAGRFCTTPEACSVVGCDWPLATQIAVAEDWRSGAYRLSLRAETGRDFDIYDHILIVRPSRRTARGTLVLIAATASWTAYNDWGGSNAYDGITGPSHDQFAPILSIHRPQARGFAVLPDGAPRVTLAEPPGLMAPISYPHMEWAYANGYSKKYASSGWAQYERHFCDWAEAEGFAVDVISQTDLHQRPELLELYRCAVFVGHDEYWTAAMRDAVDGFVERGGRVARFAGNFLWQIRLEEGGARQVCYKYRAREEDPLRDTALVTSMWEAAEVGRPGALTFGLNAARGLYAGWGACVSRGARGFPIYRPEHWAFAGTGLHYGDVLGAQSHVFGYEVDGLDYVIRDGLPYPATPQTVPDGLEILALGLSSLLEEGEDVDAVRSWLGQDDARYVASVLLGSGDAGAVQRVKRGCGMIVVFPRGRGEIFHAGSCEWVAGLLRRDPFVMKVTHSVLQRYID